MEKIAILFGGRSGEHEISILSAAAVMQAFDRSRREPIPVGIDKKGNWFLVKNDMTGLDTLDDPRLRTVIAGGASEAINPGDLPALADFAFPVLHGPYGEDGRTQGLLEMLDMPYGGCGVAASAVCMDKLLTREMWKGAGLPMCRHTALREAAWRADPDAARTRIETLLGYPLFVKPANMGSSVGISKARDAEGLRAAVAEAFRYDASLVIEEALEVRELETGVLGNGEPEVAAVGEIRPSAEFYDYDAKYRGDGTRLFIPADIPDETAANVRRLAAEAYRAVGGEGYARVDFFLEKGSGRILLNEINTLPGFTRYSMFPSLWRETGLAYRELIERIIGLGYERYHAKNNRESDFGR